jgi:hypothetical protein
VAIAQQKHHVSYDTPATQTVYTQQHVIDVGDIPGHQARLFEIRRTYGDDAPLINGSRLKEQWTRGMSDYIDNNGPALIYNVWILENGEKFFCQDISGRSKQWRWEAYEHDIGRHYRWARVASPECVASSAVMARPEPKAGINANQTDIDYWME